MVIKTRIHVVKATSYNNSKHLTLFPVEQSGSGGATRPIVNMISPVAQGLNQAMATIKRVYL